MIVIFISGIVLIIFSAIVGYIFGRIDEKNEKE